jgi:hypothetical protein
MVLSAQQLKVGDTHAEQVVDNLTRHRSYNMLALWSYNPIHTDEVYTTKVAGYPLCLPSIHDGHDGKMLTNHGDGRLTKFGVRFTKQVWPGDSLTAKATVENHARKAAGICRPATYHDQSKRRGSAQRIRLARMT